MTQKIEQQNNTDDLSAEGGNSFGPQAIYFDTSILYDVRFNGHRLEVLRNCTNYLEMPMLVPEIAVQELIQERQKDSQKFEESVKKFNSLFPDEEYHLELPDTLKILVADSTRRLLESLDIQTISLPSNLSLNPFIDLALRRVPPFEEGDKGFKDTLVLETIVRDMKQRGLGKALLLAADKIFRNDSITSRLKKEGIHLLTLDNIDAAEKCLYALIEEQETEDTKEYKTAALQYFQSNFDQIVAFVLLKLDVTVGDSIIRMLGGSPNDLPYGSTLEKVNTFTPLQVTDALPWNIGDSVEESTSDYWLISIETDFEIRVSFYTGSPFSGRTFNLAETNNFASALFTSNTQRQEIVTTVKRTVTIEATAKFDDGAFSGLKLLKAWVYLP